MPEYVIPADSNGQALPVKPDTDADETSGVVVLGVDDTGVARRLLTTIDGKLQTDQAVTVTATLAPGAVTATLIPGSEVVIGSGVESIGVVGLNPGVNTIGKVDLNTGANTIGKVGLVAGVASVGTVGLDAGVNTIGKVDLNAGSNTVGNVGIVAGVASIGTVGLNTGSNTIGKVDLNTGGVVGLATGVNTIGKVVLGPGVDQIGTVNLDPAATVGLNAGIDSIGTVGLDAGANTIGKVDVNPGATIGLEAGVASIGTVGLNSGANTIGKVDLNTGVNTIGKIDINAGSNVIGKVDLNTGATVALNAGVASVGTVGLNTGNNIVGQVKITDGSVVLGTSANPIVIRADGSFIDTNNSSTTTLNLDEVYMGVATDVLAYGKIVVSAYSDKPSAQNGFMVMFSPDNTNWDHGHSLTVRAGTTEIIETTVHNRYMKVMYTNGHITQGVFRLQTIIKPSDGSATSKTTPMHVSMVDSRIPEYVQQLTPLGESMMQQPIRLIGPAFVGTTLDDNFWSTTGSSGLGSGVTLSGGIATVAPGTAANGVGVLTSVDVARFVFAHPNKFRCATRTSDTGTANNVRRWMVNDGTDGLGFVLSGAGPNNFGICYQKDGAPITNVLTGLNGHYGNTFTWDSNVHALEIVYFTMGMWWYVDGLLIHTIIPTTAPLISNLGLPIKITTTNSNGLSSNLSADIWNATVLRMSAQKARPHHTHISTNTTTILKRGPGTLQRIIINTPGGNSNTITLYDNTAGSGTVIGILDNLSRGSIDYSIDFNIGLTVVTASGAAPDLTIVYD